MPITRARSAAPRPRQPTHGAVIVLIGPAGAGKSTAAALWPAQHILSSDVLRTQLHGSATDQQHNTDVFTELHRRLEYRCRRGYTTIVDATSVHRAHRSALLDIAERAETPAVALVLDTPLEASLARQQYRTRRVPASVIIDQYYAIQPHTQLTHEPWHAIRILRQPITDVTAPAEGGTTTCPVCTATFHTSSGRILLCPNNRPGNPQHDSSPTTGE